MKEINRINYETKRLHRKWDSNKGKWRVRLIKAVLYLDTIVDDEREGAKMRDVVS
jgi:hypothetical protein